MRLAGCIGTRISAELALARRRPRGARRALVDRDRLCLVFILQTSMPAPKINAATVGNSWGFCPVAAPAPEAKIEIGKIPRKRCVASPYSRVNKQRSKQL